MFLLILSIQPFIGVLYALILKAFECVLSPLNITFCKLFICTSFTFFWISCASSFIIVTNSNSVVTVRSVYNMSKSDEFKKKLMLDEITFYSICGEDDRKKILNEMNMSFNDFRRLSLLTDYLGLNALHKFIQDMYEYKFLDQIAELWQQCQEHPEFIPSMILDTGEWLDDFWKQAPNDTVAYLLHEVFENGLPQEKDTTFDDLNGYRWTLNDLYL